MPQQSSPALHRMSKGVGSGILRVFRGSRRGVYRDECPALPLEQVRQRRGIATLGIKLHCSLNGVEGDARVECADNFGIIKAFSHSDDLVQHLSHRVRLCHVRVNLIGGTAVLGQVVLHHLCVLEVIGLWIPAVRNEYPLRILHTANSLDKNLTKVRPGGRNERFGVVVLFLKDLYVSLEIRKQRAENNYLRLRLNYLFGDGGNILRKIIRIRFFVRIFGIIKDSCYTSALQQLLCYHQLWLREWVVRSRIGDRLGPL